MEPTRVPAPCTPTPAGSDCTFSVPMPLPCQLGGAALLCRLSPEHLMRASETPREGKEKVELIISC